jgi:hypothetical protein
MAKLENCWDSRKRFGLSATVCLGSTVGAVGPVATREVGHVENVGHRRDSWNRLDGLEWFGLERFGLKWDGLEWKGLEWDGVESSELFGVA